MFFAILSILSPLTTSKFFHLSRAYLKRTHNASADGEFPVIFRRHTRDGNQNSVVSDENNKPGDGFANPVYMYQGASESSIQKNVIKEQGASGSSCPRNMVKEHGTQEQKNGTHRTSNAFPKLFINRRNVSDRKGGFENPVYGYANHPIEAKEENSNSSEKVQLYESTNGTHGNQKEESVRRKERIIPTKKNKKPKGPESFANPLYGSNTGPAQLDVIVTQHENGATITPGNQRSHENGVAEENGVQNSDGIAATGDAELEKQDAGIKEKILRRLRKGHDIDGQRMTKEQPHFLHI